MDLGLIKQRIISGAIISLDDLSSDLFVMCNNAMVFNGKGDPYFDYSKVRAGLNFGPSCPREKGSVKIICAALVRIARTGSALVPNRRCCDLFFFSELSRHPSTRRGETNPQKLV